MISGRTKTKKPRWNPGLFCWEEFSLYEKEREAEIEGKEFLDPQLQLFPFLLLYFRVGVVAGTAGHDSGGGLLALPAAGEPELVGVIFPVQRRLHCQVWAAFCGTYTIRKNIARVADNSSVGKGEIRQSSWPGRKHPISYHTECRSRCRTAFECVYRHHLANRDVFLFLIQNSYQFAYRYSYCNMRFLRIYLLINKSIMIASVKLHDTKVSPECHKMINTQIKICAF